jgi:hypothetical protein
VYCARTPNTVAEERQRVGEREGGVRGIKYGNKIWNSGDIVWDRDNMGTGEMNIE